MSYEVALDQFSGPLQLLLELIEGEKLPITEVSLGKVTEDYLAYVNTHEVPAEELADFLVVATRLLLIKSRAILPQAVAEEEDAGNLTEQLRMYKRFVDAAEKLEAIYLSASVLFPRERSVVPRRREFLPPPSVTPASLREAFRSLRKRLEPFFALKQTSLERVVSVQERMRQLRDAFVERSNMMFHDMIGAASSKVEIVVSFLALLELMKQRVLTAVQGESFAQIAIRRNGEAENDNAANLL